MIKIPETNGISYFDVDDTLVLWNKAPPEVCVKFDHPEGWTEYLLPHKKHILYLKTQKAKGKTIVVWSQGGSDWAETIVKTLQLEPWVDLCIGKPTEYIDDLNCNNWMNRKYFDDTDKT